MSAIFRLFPSRFLCKACSRNTLLPMFSALTKTLNGSRPFATDSEVSASVAVAKIAMLYGLF